MRAGSDYSAAGKIVLPPREASFVLAWSFLFIAGSLLQVSGIASGQESTARRSVLSPMQEHYEAAFRFQGAGKLSQADAEYKLFLSLSLHHVANGRANNGDYARAAELYEQALKLTPKDLSLEMDYANAALDASDWKKAKALATSILNALKSNAQPPDPRAVVVLAQALLGLGEHQAALEEFKAAAQLRPGYDTAYGLASAYLVLGDKASAVKIFDEMPATYGDTAALHMKLGILYGNTKFFDESIEEFKKALAKDSRLQGVHYSLGASYMMRSGEPAFDQAEMEFRKELALYPNNSLVNAPLGRIAMTRHRYAEAEADLKRAIELHPQIAGTYLTLGELYRETERIPEAEAAFRKGIALTLDPSKNGYEVEQAHFWLGRLLIQEGNLAEGRKELDISKDLLYLKSRLLESKLAGSATLQAPLEKTHEANPEDSAAQTALEKQVGQVIASSYDNLGVNAAKAGDFENASGYFEQAAEWDPRLAGVDENWGRAAFAAKQYAQAVTPLGRILALHPQDTEARSMLGVSNFMIHDYAHALSALQPIEATLGENPMLTLAYSGSMAISGNYSLGLARLHALEEAHPDVAIIHCLIGEAYASKGNFAQSAGELRSALKLDPSNPDAKNALALADLALGEKTEALQQLSELAESGSADGEIYYRLAQLQIDLGLAGAAIGTMETAIRMNPMNTAYHRELAEAYRRNAQPEEAERESQQSEILQAYLASSRQSGKRDSASGNHSGDSSPMQVN